MPDAIAFAFSRSEVKLAMCARLLLIDCTRFILSLCLPVIPLSVQMCVCARWPMIGVVC